MQLHALLLFIILVTQELLVLAQLYIQQKIQRFVLSKVLGSPLSSGLKCETVRGHKNPIKILDGLSEM